MTIKTNLEKIKSEIGNDIVLVAVSKTKPISDIMQAYETGHLHFGENKVQDMVEKYEEMPKDIKWHMIGHVQRNKVKYMAEFVHLIHGVDSLKLLKEIDKQAKKHSRVIDCLLQIKIADEDSKFGMSLDEATKIITSKEFSELKNIAVVGVMGMATYTNDNSQIRKEFKRLKTNFLKLKDLEESSSCFKIVSMGMSGDYKLAIEEGSTMIRVGSRIFGSRNY